MSSRAHFLRLVSFATTLAVIAACGDGSEPIAPGFAEFGILYGAVGRDSSTDASYFSANRAGQVTAVVCGPSDANFDAAVVRDGAPGDTLAVGTATTGCETLQFPVATGARYRFLVHAVSGRGSYAACFAYDAARCATVQPTVPTRAGVPLGYYLAAEGKSDTALITALHDVIAKGHYGFEYDTARGWLYQISVPRKITSNLPPSMRRHAKQTLLFNFDYVAIANR